MKANLGYLVGLVIVAMLGVAAAGCRQPIAYSAESFDGARTVSLSDLRGKPALLTSWATWCTICRVELPQLEQFYQAHKAARLQFVAVNVDGEESQRTAADMARSFGLSILLWRDPRNRFTAAFQGVAVPTSVLLDADGQIVHIWQGAMTEEDFLELIRCLNIDHYLIDLC